MVFVSTGPNSTSCLIFYLFGRKRCKAIDNINWAIHKKGFDELIGNYSWKNLNPRLHFLKGFISPVKLKAASSSGKAERGKEGL